MVRIIAQTLRGLRLVLGVLGWAVTLSAVSALLIAPTFFAVEWGYHKALFAYIPLTFVFAYWLAWLEGP